MAHFEDQVKKKQAVIARLQEKTFSAAIKTTMLGQDAAKSEYWHFKDDRGRIYVRTEEEVPVLPVKSSTVVKDIEMEDKEQDAGDSQGVDAAGGSPLSQGIGGEEDIHLGEEEIGLTETKYHWFYYEDEDQFEALLQGLNPKGLKERKLQEGLRKIKERLKLQKPKKVKTQEPAAEQKEEQKTDANKQEAPLEGTKEEAKVDDTRKDVEMANTENAPDKAENQEEV